MSDNVDSVRNMRQEPLIKLDWRLDYPKSTYEYRFCLETPSDVYYLAYLLAT